MKEIRCHLGIFLIGGGAYTVIELLWRGYTHWSMFLVGGLCFQLIGWIHTLFVKWGMVRRCALCSLAITFVEFLSGCIFNLALGMKIWDYSRTPFNVMGQVCLLYSVLWGILSIAALPIYRFCRSFLMTGQLPRIQS